MDGPPPDHHEGFIDWETYEANQTRIGTNVHPSRTRPVGRWRGHRVAARSRDLRTLRPPTAPLPEAARLRPATTARARTWSWPRRLLPHGRRCSDRRGGDDGFLAAAHPAALDAALVARRSSTPTTMRRSRSGASPSSAAV